jgi:hypothetical protein
MAVVDDAGVTVLVTHSRKQVCKLNSGGVKLLSFSSKGSFITTWKQPSRDESGATEKNLKVFPSRAGGVAIPLSFIQFACMMSQ